LKPRRKKAPGERGARKEFFEVVGRVFVVGGTGGVLAKLINVLLILPEFLVCVF
jgi:hypothetical protein